MFVSWQSSVITNNAKLQLETVLERCDLKMLEMRGQFGSRGEHKI